MPDYSQLTKLLREIIEKQLSHDRKKSLMLLLHESKKYSRQENLPEMLQSLVDIEACLGFGQDTDAIDYEKLQALVVQLDEVLSNQETAQDGESCAPDSANAAALTDTQPSSFTTTDEQVIELTICNCTSRDEARDIARGLIESRLAACINIIANIGSIYRWEGQIYDTSECQLQIKSTPVKRDLIQKFIKQKHSNEVPEIISFPIQHGNVDYMQWVIEEVTEVETH